MKIKNLGVYGLVTLSSLGVIDSCKKYNPNIEKPNYQCINEMRVYSRIVEENKREELVKGGLFFNSLFLSLCYLKCKKEIEEIENEENNPKRKN